MTWPTTVAILCIWFAVAFVAWLAPPAAITAAIAAVFATMAIVES